MAQQPPPGSTPRLALPIAVPQIAPRYGVPFPRAFAPCLLGHGINMEEFVGFIDNLNVILSASPPLQVLDLTGTMVSMVPYHWTIALGITAQVVAKVGRRVTSKRKTEKFLKKANKEFFERRGLKVEIANGKALAAILGVGGMLGKDGIEIEPPRVETMGLEIQERRLKALEGRIATLQFEGLPPPAEQTGKLAKMTQKLMRREQKSKEKKIMKNRKAALEKMKGSGETRIEKEERRTWQEAKEKIEEAMREMSSRRREEDIRKAQTERHRSLAKLYEDKVNEEWKDQKDLTKKDKEIKMGRKLLWIIVRNLKDCTNEGRSEKGAFS